MSTFTLHLAILRPYKHISPVTLLGTTVLHPVVHCPNLAKITSSAPCAWLGIWVWCVRGGGWRNCCCCCCWLCRWWVCFPVIDFPVTPPVEAPVLYNISWTK